jgi:type II secretory pathway pseudopilin PulG
MNPTERPVKKRYWRPHLVWDAVLALTSIWVLISILLPNYGVYSPKAAFRAKASDQANQIYTACLAYKTEYGTLPENSENYRLIKILCGDNPRKIEFLSLIPRDVNPNGEMIDQWGTPFRITFDSDAKIHVVSAGPDKIFGTPDDITNE